MNDGQRPEGESACAEEEYRFTFTGSGEEYFRIWIVNLALTVATLGLFSAWAKVRRQQYFNRNTMLASASFDFHANPATILKGRLLGVVLMVLYDYAFGFSLPLCLALVCMFLLALPLLMRSALRFRLANTSYRGLRFGFDGGIGAAYRAYLPPLAAVLLPSVLFLFFSDTVTVAVTALVFLGWPWMHGAMKRYQHAHLAYGTARSRYELAPESFYRPYLITMAIALSVFGACLIVPIVVVWLHLLAVAESILDAFPFIAGYLIFQMTVPYLQARVANLAWSHTTLGPVRWRSRLAPAALVRLHVGNAVLTLLTLGLYRPFGVVRVYRYRLACVALLAHGSVETIAASAVQPARAAGDAATDLLGFDLSW